jgi:hypothetical protein
MQMQVGVVCDDADAGAGCVSGDADAGAGCLSGDAGVCLREWSCG